MLFSLLSRHSVAGVPCGIALASIYNATGVPVNAEGQKRKFYQDLQDDIAVPGTNSAITKKLLQKETPNENNDIEAGFADGMSVRTSDFLEKKLNGLRKWSIDHLERYFYEYQTAKSSLNNELTAASNKFHSIVVEPVLPNLIYILTGSLTGSVLVNRKSLPIRLITPIIFGTAFFGYLMPQSYSNTKQWIWVNEKDQFPYFAQQHIQFLISLEENKQWTYKKLDESHESLNGKVHNVRQSIKNIFEF